MPICWVFQRRPAAAGEVDFWGHESRSLEKWAVPLSIRVAWELPAGHVTRERPAASGYAVAVGQPRCKRSSLVLGEGSGVFVESA